MKRADSSELDPSDTTSLMAEHDPRKAQLTQEIHEFAHACQAQEQHRAALLATLNALESRIAAAGFVAISGTTYQCEYQPMWGQYRVEASGKWVHPECAVPLLVELSLTLHTTLMLRGQVNTLLRLVDDPHTGDGFGVLSGCPFREELLLARNAEFDNSAAWREHVSQAMSKLTAETFKDVFARAMVHLEEVTSP